MGFDKFFMYRMSVHSILCAFPRLSCPCYSADILPLSLLHYMSQYKSELSEHTVLCFTSYIDSTKSASSWLVDLIGVPHVLGTTSNIAFYWLICIFAGCQTIVRVLRLQATIQKTKRLTLLTMRRHKNLHQPVLHILSITPLWFHLFCLVNPGDTDNLALLLLPFANRAC